MSVNDHIANVSRKKKFSVLAYGEGEDEKIFLRHLVNLYCRRNKVAVTTGSANGGDPIHILSKAILARGSVKRDYEFILLDTDKPWPEDMINRAKEEQIELIGNDPCLESFFLEILKHKASYKDISSWRCKSMFEEEYTTGNFNEDECLKIFNKPFLNSARSKNEKLDKLIKLMEGEV